MRLAQAASAVTLQRHAAQVYRLLDKVQALSPVANAEAAALRARLLAVRGAIPQVLIDYADPALRTQAQTLQTRLQAQGLGVRLRSTPAAADDFSAGWQPTGRSDRALGRWVATQAGRVMQSEALAAQAAPTAASGDATDTFNVPDFARSPSASGTPPTTARTAWVFAWPGPLPLESRPLYLSIFTRRPGWQLNHPAGMRGQRPAAAREAGALGPLAGLGTPGWWAGLGSDVPVAAVIDPAFAAVPAQPEVLAGRPFATTSHRGAG